MDERDDMQIRVLRGMSAEEKLRAARQLYWSARRWKAAWIRHLHSDWTAEQVQQAVREVFAHART